MKLVYIISSVLATKELSGIVGGEEVNPPFRYPWIVSLQHYGVHLCGGTLYNEKTIITAAHCTKGRLDKWTAQLHRHNLESRISEEQGLVFPILEQIDHPNYDSAFTKKYDISIWKTKAVAVAPIALGSEAPLFLDNLITVIGWGRVGENKGSSNVLLQIAVPFYDQEKCKKAYNYMDLVSQYCAGYATGAVDSCRGDSGGPAFVAKDHGYTLVGVVSWGRGCAKKNRPGVYTRVHHVKDFILKHAS